MLVAFFVMTFVVAILCFAALKHDLKQEQYLEDLIASSKVPEDEQAEQHYDSCCYICEDGHFPSNVCNKCLATYAGNIFKDGDVFGFIDSKWNTQKGWDSLGACIIAFRRDSGDWSK